MGLTDAQARARIDEILGRYQESRGGVIQSVLPPNVAAGKTYEAWVLCDVLERLSQQEAFDIELVNGSKVVLKTSGGPINRDYAHFALHRGGHVQLEVWTDIYVLGMSAQDRGVSKSRAEPCDFHELDVVVVGPGVVGMPWPDEIRIGIECKDSPYDKQMLRSILGIRRELSLLRNSQVTGFRSWPAATVPAEPPSCLLVYSSHPGITAFQPPGDHFGITFVHEPMV